MDGSFPPEFVRAGRSVAGMGLRCQSAMGGSGEEIRSKSDWISRKSASSAGPNVTFCENPAWCARISSLEDNRISGKNPVLVAGPTFQEVDSRMRPLGPGHV